MSIDVEIKNDNLIAILNGEIDHHYATEVKNVLENEYRDTKFKNIVMSFKNIRFMDSSGIGMVIGRFKFAKARGGTLVACNLTLEAKRIFDISGLGKIIEVYDDIDSAISSLSN